VKTPTLPRQRDHSPGVRIIDLTSVMMGPYATMILGDYGRRVIKVESPDGDVMALCRADAPSQHGRDVPCRAIAIKRSIVLDLKKSGGREPCCGWRRPPDVFVHICAAGRDGPPQARCRRSARLNPRLVYASLHGFGERGPYAGRPAMTI